MIASRMSQRDRRALLLGLPCLLALVIAFRGIPAWKSWRDETRLLATEAESRLAAQDELLASFDEALDTLEARTARLKAAGPGLVSGETAAGAGSTLAALVAELARGSLVRLDAVNLRIDTTQGGFMPRLSADLQATSDITGLSLFLEGLERGPTILAVRRVQVRASAGEVPPGQVEQLTVQLTVEALGLVLSPGDSL